jgi:hypothetical protein
VSWTPPSGGGPVTGYTIGWGHDQPPRTLSVGPTTLNATVAPIVPSVRYEIWVRAFDDSGTGPTSTPWVNVTLTAYSVIAGTVDPSNATVWLDGVTNLPVVDGSYRVNTSVGAHLLNVTAPGYRPSIATFSTPWNGTKFENFTLLRDLGNITGVVSPSGASLTWMGEPVPVGAGGVYRITGTAGTTGVLRANETAYHNATETLTIPADALLWANLTLLPVYGVLVLRVDPRNASVSEDGYSITINASGAARLTLVAGTYQIRASSYGYTTDTEPTTVVAGEVDRLNLTLSVAPPTPTSPPVDLGPLIAAAVGVVVVVLAVLVVLLLWRRRMPPASGSPRPPGSEPLYGDAPPPRDAGPRELPEGSDGPRDGSDGRVGGSDPIR